jgi:serine/threonine protein kinase
MRATSAPPPVRSIAPPPMPIGEVIAGKYRITSLIGEGGMGAVFAARHELLDVQVAVKLLSPAHVRHRALVERFLREAQAAARLKSEHVARVMDVGTLDSGEPYIVMDLLEGEDLEQRLERVGRMPVPEAVDALLQALEAMGHAHAAGIVHRDLKPANLFVTVMPDGREIIKVLDFGIAKLTDTAQSGKGVGTRSGTVTDEHAALGSPSYMAPEQVRVSPDIDPRADLWALGAILYELVTGQVAFGGQSVGEIFGAVLHERPRPLHSFCPEAPAALEGVITRCLERDRAARFADVAELARALVPFGSGAWTGHVTRIEQTLARAGMAGGADTQSSRRQDSVERMARARVPTPVPALRRTGPHAFARSAAAGAETLAAEPEATDVPLHPRRGAPARIVATLGTIAATAAVIVAVRPALLGKIEAPPAKPSPVAIAAAPGPPPETPMPADPRPSASPAESAAMSTPAPVPAPPRAAKPNAARVSPPSKSGTPHPPRLPGVLDSPE